MILLHQHALVFKDQAFNLPQVSSANSSILGETHRLKPEFALSVWRSNMDMGRLARLIRIEVKTIRAY